MSVWVVSACLYWVTGLPAQQTLYMQRSVNSTVTTFTSVVAQNDPRPFEKHTRSIKDQLWHAGHALSENSDQAKDKLSL